MAPRRHRRSLSATKIYLVFKGRNPGFYYSWPDCEAQVSGFPGNLHKSYNTMADAESAWLRYWSRTAAFGEVHAAATALHGQEGPEGCNVEELESPTPLLLDSNEEVRSTSAVAAALNYRGRYPCWAVYVTLVIGMAVVWALCGWM